MKNFIKRYFTPIAICSVLLTMMVSSCAKDDYFIDGGPAKAKFDGSILQYLQSNSKFDTIAQIVKLAGMEDVFTNEKITFFAPTDEVIRRTIGLVNSRFDDTRNGLNQRLFTLQKDTIKVLADVPSATWKKFLMRYIFKGSFVLKDYSQLDFNLKAFYPGGFYFGYNNDLANIGVVYNDVITDVSTVKYTGYRQLSISYIPDSATPENFIPVAVASSDIQPNNGVVHVLAVYVSPFPNGVFSSTRLGSSIHSSGANVFGFNDDFNQEVILSR